MVYNKGNTGGNDFMRNQTTIGEYLIHRLEELGVADVFGVPGDYVLGFYDLLVESRMNVIGTCTEAGAGFATDAYARVNGLGVLCITYCVGGLNALNSVAGAYAEKSPVIVISGAPGLNERAKSPLLHHKVRDFNTQRLIFEKVTVAAVAIEDASTAPRDIDDMLEACLRHKRPVYIELPRDMVEASCALPKPWKTRWVESDPDALDEAIAETSAMVRNAKRPVILAGSRFTDSGCRTYFASSSKVRECRSRRRCWARASSARYTRSTWVSTRAQRDGRMSAGSSRRRTAC